MRLWNILNKEIPWRKCFLSDDYEKKPERKWELKKQPDGGQHFLKCLSGLLWMNVELSLALFIYNFSQFHFSET